MSPEEVKRVNENTKATIDLIGIKPGYIFVFGSALSMTISWSVNKSIVWALLHGLFNWFYIFYYAFGFGH